MKHVDKRKKQVLFITILCLFVSLFIYVSFQFHYERIYTLLLEKDVSQMKETSHYVTQLVESKIQHIVAYLDVNQKRLVTYKKKTDVIENLKFLSQEMSFDRVGIVDVQGNALDENGQKLILNDSQLLSSLSEGKEYISNLVEQDDMMLIAVPVMRNNQIVGGLWGYYRVDNIANSIEFDNVSYRYFQIIDSEGHYISLSNNKHSFATGEILWDEIKKYDLYHTTSDKIRENMQTGALGEFYFRYQNQGRYVFYEPLGMNNWYVFSVLTEDDLMHYVRDIEKIFSFLLWSIIGCIVVILVIVGRSIYLSTKKIRDKNHELEARNSLLFMVIHHTNDVPFEVNLYHKTVTIYYIRGKEEVVRRSLDEYTPENMLKQGKIFEEDYELYCSIYDSMMNSMMAEPSVLKLKFDNQWSSKKIHYNVIGHGLIVGFLENYDELVNKEEKIKEINFQSQLDALTQLYNRNLFKSQVEDILEKKDESFDETYSALFILDLDNFKQANDTMGHMMGDYILSDCAKALKSVVRSSDVCGRLGGDEFMLFIQGAKDLQAIEVCAKKIKNVLHKTYQKDGKAITMSVSIGIAVFQKNATFDELYQLADQALYKVKQEKKNDYLMLTLKN